MEKPWLDQRVQHTFHWDVYGKFHKTEGKVVRVPGMMEGWHTFAIWWKGVAWRRTAPPLPPRDN
jgi:hypothetical protein